MGFDELRGNPQGSSCSHTHSTSRLNISVEEACETSFVKHKYKVVNLVIGFILRMENLIPSSLLLARACWTTLLRDLISALHNENFAYDTLLIWK